MARVLLSRAHRSILSLLLALRVYTVHQTFDTKTVLPTIYSDTCECQHSPMRLKAKKLLPSSSSCARVRDVEEADASLTRAQGLATPPPTAAQQPLKIVSMKLSATSAVLSHLPHLLLHSSMQPCSGTARTSSLDPFRRQSHPAVAPPRDESCPCTPDLV